MTGRSTDARRAWLWLLAAGGFEIAFTTCLKLDGTVADLLFVAAAGLSFFCMTRAMRAIPLGTVYAVWTAIGAVGTVIVGILAFGDPLTGTRLFFLALIVAVIVALKLVSPAQDAASVPDRPAP
ncbi:MAG: multidrug efflux SMR transporter [Rhodospirillales bacterium]